MSVFFTRRGKAPARVNFVEYIQSTGTQYIDTLFKPNNNTRVVMDVELLSTTAQPCTLFGARQSAAANNYAFMLTDGVLRSDYNNTYTQTWNVTITGRHKIDKNKETTTVDGTAKSYTNAAFQAPCNLFLLALNNNGSKQWYIIARLYSCQIYDNGTLIRDYWPCYDEEGVLCLYDRVNKEYVYNAGTGEFVYEHTVCNVTLDLTAGTSSYVNYNGTQYIGTAETIDVVHGGKITVVAGSGYTGAERNVFLNGVRVATATDYTASYTHTVTADCSVVSSRNAYGGNDIHITTS